MPIEDYLEQYKDFRKSNYPYRQMKNRDTAKFLIEKGRLIVLPNTRGITYALLCIAIISAMSFAIVYGLEVIILHHEWPPLTIIIIGGIMLIFVGIGLIVRISWEFFYILGPEGIVYKKSRRDAVKLVGWKDIIKIDVSDAPHSGGKGSGTVYTKKFEISFSDNNKLVFDTYYLNLKEFPSLNQTGHSTIEDLVVFVLNEYYNQYKNKE